MEHYFWGIWKIDDGLMSQCLHEMSTTFHGIKIYKESRESYEWNMCENFDEINKICWNMLAWGENVIFFVYTFDVNNYKTECTHEIRGMS